MEHESSHARVDELAKYAADITTADRLTRIFTYHAPKLDQPPRYEVLRRLALDLSVAIVKLTPPSREQSLALTKLEECVMHANSAIARHE